MQPWFSMYSFDIWHHIMSNWHLSNQVICWPVSHDHISQVQVCSSSRSCVLLKVTADQVLVFDWIMGSCQVNLLKTEPGCFMVFRKPAVNSNPGLKVNQIITGSSIQMSFVYSFFVWCISFVIIKLKIEGQTIYRKPHCKVTKLESKFSLILG